MLAASDIKALLEDRRRRSQRPVTDVACDRVRGAAVEHDALLGRVPAEIRMMGAPEQIHRVSPWVHWVCWLAALACLMTAATALYSLSKQLETNAVPREAMLIASIAFVTGSLLASDVAFWVRTFAYLVFRDALVQVRGGRWTIFRWDEIEEVVEKPRGARSRYRLVLADGRTTSIAPIVTNHQALGETIVARVGERVTPQTLQFLAQGGNVGLGPSAAVNGSAADTQPVSLE
jgi:hypothetical protein